jgi:hypothetical protein
MKQADRQKIANAIRAGLPYLWNGRGIWGNEKTEYICFAIDRTWGLGRASNAVAAAKAVIHQRIAPYSTVEDWLEAQGVKRIGYRKLQAYRKAWMKLLIEEFSK